MATRTLRTLLENVDTGQLQLPEIQREFVWQRKSIKLLFDSLYKGLPIGQMLVWKTSKEVAGHAFEKAKKGKSAGKIHNFYGYLLDGQQRLTAIARVRDADDAYPLQFDLWPNEGGYDGHPFFWGQVSTAWGPWALPVSEVLDPDNNLLDYLERLKMDVAYTPQRRNEAHLAMTKLRNILDYPVAIAEFESDDYLQATELFVRFNSTGKRLNKNDLALAELATRVPGLAATAMAKAAGHWHPQFTFTRPFLIQCLVAVHTSRMNLQKPKELWADAEEHSIEASWAMTQQALDSLVNFLTGSVRWTSANWVPSFNALIPLIYIIAHSGPLTPADRQKARSWLILASVRAHFSGAVYTELDRILRKLNLNPSVAELWKVTKKSLSKIEPYEFDVTRRSGPMMSLYISMLREKNARSWGGDAPLDGTVLGKGAGLQVHHFFPKALMTRHEYSLDAINTFANLTVLSAEDNLNISMEEPATYLQRIGVDSKQLEIQCIPPDNALLHVDRYPEFVEARRKLLTQQANEFLLGE